MLDGYDFNFRKGWVMFMLDQPCWMQNGLNKSTASTSGLWTIRRIKGRRRESWLRPQGTPMFWWVHHPLRPFAISFNSLKPTIFTKNNGEIYWRTALSSSIFAHKWHERNDKPGSVQLGCPGFGGCGFTTGWKILVKTKPRFSKGVNQIERKNNSARVLVVFPVMGNVR